MRYWLLREVPPGADADYTAERLEGRYNADLANDLGNLLQRTVSMLQRYRQGEIPALPEAAPGGASPAVAAAAVGGPAPVPGPLRPPERPGGAVGGGGAGQPLRRGDGALGAGPPRAGRASAEAGARLDRVLVTLVEALRVVGEALRPFLPGTAGAVLAQLGQAPAPRWEEGLRWGRDGNAPQGRVGPPGPSSRAWPETVRTGA